MAEKLIPLHGPSVGANAYVGTNSEISVDSEDFTLLVHDGVTQGGHRLAKEVNVHTTLKEVRDGTRNIYGRSTFLNDAFKVKHATGKYYLSAGKAILGGINCELETDLEVVPGTLPATIWLDVYQETSMVGVLNKYDVVVNDGTALPDYNAGAVEHTLVKLGVVNSSSDIVDSRDYVSSDLSLVSKESREADLCVDLDTISKSKTYYTNETTLNRINDISLGFVDVIVDHVEIDINNAVQRAVGYNKNLALFRNKIAGVWQPWQVISSSELRAKGWPVIIDENIIGEPNVTTISGWTGDVANIASDGASLTITGTSKKIEWGLGSNLTSGDWISYIEAQADDGPVTFSHGPIGIWGVVLSLGYKWSNESKESGLVSVCGAINGIPTTFVEFYNDYSTKAIQVALHYDSVNNVFNVFNKINTGWEFKGSVVNEITHPHEDKTHIATSSYFTGSATIHSWKICRPNLVAIGDSVTAGHNLYDPDPDFYTGVDNYNSTWMAHASIYKNLTNNLIVNYGIGGQNSQQIDNRVNQVMNNSKAKVVFLHCSTNDYGPRFSDAVRNNNIQSSVDKVKALGASVILINSVYPNGPWLESVPYYRDWWINQSDNITGVALKADIMGGSGILTGTSMDAAYTEADGVHPNVAGYTLIGQYIKSLETT